MTRVVFVCTGNTCRSPMAEALFRQLAEEAGLMVETRSAGVAAIGGAPISSHSRSVLERRGLSCEHRSKMLSVEDVRWADHILTMTMSHKRIVIEHFPEAVHKVHTLKEFAMDDPELLGIIEEREALIAQLQLNTALNQPITEEHQSRLMELEKIAPDYDVQDPFGGSLQLYAACALEIEMELRRVIARLRGQ